MYCYIEFAMLKLARGAFGGDVFYQAGRGGGGVELGWVNSTQIILTQKFFHQILEMRSNHNPDFSVWMHIICIPQTHVLRFS